MIVKRIDRAKGTSSFKRLATYILDKKHDGEKLDREPVLTNFGVGSPDHLESVVANVEDVQARSRAKGDKTYHLIVSFPAGERPTPEQMRDIEATLVEAVGYSAHQRLSAVHEDTGHLHLHIGINKVHPTTFRMHTPRRDFPRLQAAARGLEVRHGLQVVAGRYRGAEGPAQAEAMQPQVRPEGRPADLEAHAGRESLAGFLRREVAPVLLVALQDPKATWQTVHDALRPVAVVIVQQGAGLVMRDLDTGKAVRASGVARELSHKRLQDQLGPFLADKQVPSRTPEKKYTGRPLQRHPVSAGLFAEYQAERKAVQQARGAERNARLEYAKKLKAYYQASYQLIRKRSGITRQERRNAYQALANERKSDWAKHQEAVAALRQGPSEDPGLPTWNAFLMARALGGDERALLVLRSLPTLHLDKPKTGNHLTVADAANTASRPLNYLPSKVQKDGSVVYQFPDGARIQDSPDGIHVPSSGRAHVAAALSVAATRFAGHPIEVTGSPTFRSTLAQLAGQRGLAVQFADPSLEQERAGAVAPERSSRPSPALLEVLSPAVSPFGSTFAITMVRDWTRDDAGGFIYRGQQQLKDGSTVLLLQRAHEGFVLPLDAVGHAELTHHQPGAAIRIDERGRVVGPALPPRD